MQFYGLVIVLISVLLSLSLMEPLPVGRT